jgi:acetoin utilization deacetylase AcuC-like enzyme
MGFCLINNIGVTAGVLASQGQKVAIVDWDVHHGNGTQAMFYRDPRVLYVSIHQFPFYPYEGRAEEIGDGPGVGTTVNIPVPAGTAGDGYRVAWQEIIIPVLRQYDADWILVSAGYDAHSEDPLAELRLEANDFGWMAAQLGAIHGDKPLLLFLEGGYHLPALTTSVTATLLGLVGETPELTSEFHSPPETLHSIEKAKEVAGQYWSL